MTIPSSTRAGSKLFDKHALQKAVAELDERMGFVHDATATAEKAQAMMRARGIRPEDHFLSKQIIHVRHEHEEEK